MLRVVFLIFFITSCTAENESSPILRIAVSSNFTKTLSSLKNLFESSSRIQIKIIQSSTGSLRSQIISGAPFDLFLSADTFSVEAISTELKLPGSNSFTYAVGELALLHNGKFSKLEDLETLDWNCIAVPDFKMAPYGKAAIKALRSLNSFSTFSKKIIFTKSAVGSYRLVKLGECESGFTSLSLALNSHHFRINQKLYPHLIQKGLILKASGKTKEFISFLKSEKAERIIKSNGYRVVKND